MKKTATVVLTLLATLAPLLLHAQSDEPQKGVIAFSVAYLRSAPDYESGLETQALMGSEVEVLDKDRYWLKVRLSDPEYEAWVTDMAVVPKAEVPGPGYVCTVFHTVVRSGPSMMSGAVGELVLGDETPKALSKEGRPVTVRGFSKVILPDGKEGWVRKGDVKDLFEWRTSRERTPAAASKTACEFVGIPYLWGGNSVKGLDCSGLVWLAVHMNGIVMPRNAGKQAKLGEEVPFDGSWGSLLPGDLIFYGTPATEECPARVSHVAISLGGADFVHSSQIVRRGSLDPSSPDYYRRVPLFVRRISCK